MARPTQMTPELYERLVTAFRVHPDKPSKVARELSISRDTAADAWRRGCKQLGLPPIRDRLAEPPEVTARRVVAEATVTAEGAARRLVEDATARAVLEATAEEAARAAKEKARRDAREAREQAAARADNRDNAANVMEVERKLRGGLRQVTGQNLIASTKTGPALILIAEELVDRLERLRKELPIEQLLEAGKVLAQIDRARASLVRESAELERLHRGDPSVILGVTPTQMSWPETIEELRTGERVLRRLEQKARGIIAGDPVAAAVDVTPAR